MCEQLIIIPNSSEQLLQQRVDELRRRKGVEPPLFVIPNASRGESLADEIRRLERLPDAQHVSEQTATIGRIVIPAVEHRSVPKKPFVIPAAHDTLITE